MIPKIFLWSWRLVHELEESHETMWFEVSGMKFDNVINVNKSSKY